MTTPSAEALEAAKAIRCEDDVYQPALGTWQLRVVALALDAARHRGIEDAQVSEFQRGWDAFRDTLKPRIFGAGRPFEIKDALEIINTHHFGWYAPVGK